MIKTLTYYFLFIFLICHAFTNAQTSSSSNVEIKNERGMYSKVFLKQNGDHEAIFSPSPLHYKKSGAWEEINTLIIPDNTGYKNESNVIQSYFPNSIDSTGKIRLIINSSDELFIHSEKKLMLLNDQNILNSIAVNSNNSNANVIDNSINYSNIYTDISDGFSILNGQVKNNIVLNIRPAVLDNVNSGYFGFQETLEIPKGWKIINQDNSLNLLTSSALLILDSTGNSVLSIPEPVFFDNNGLEPDGANSIKGKYLVERKNNEWTITTLVPVAWLKDVNTSYPVVVDPTVVIAGNTGGWQSPNNFVDNPAFVFVGVCCGNQTHRAWIKFNISGIPTTSCITNVEIQPNVITVVANTPEVVLINDVTGAFGPYGAIVPAAYTDFGNGNYTSFTINGTGLYGYYSLGASANALLQAQLAGGWFEVAFQFSNEPSTNYKVIDATSSNLRVTYSAPPCVVLPIELLSFEAKCDKNKVNLNWSTASQINNDYFTVERTANGIDYEVLGMVKGAGNSNQTLNYSFVDTRPLEGTSYYSLKQTDFNGQSKTLNLVQASCSNTKEFTIFPNPSAGAFSIEGVEQGSDIIIRDVLGQLVFQTKITREKTEIDLSNHLNGIYFVQVTLKNGISSRKVILNK